MNAFEIATAVQEQLPIRVFVFNDGRLGMVENGHEKVYGRRPSYSTGQLDICDIARGLGASVAKIDGIGQLARAQQTMRNVAGPVVFDVRIDHTIQLAKKDRVAAFTTPPRESKPALRVIN